MKKISVSTIAFFLMVIECKSQQNLKYYELHGKIRSIKVKDFEAIDKFGEITKGKLLYGFYIYYFNLNGNVTEIDNFQFQPYSPEEIYLSSKDIIKYDFNENEISFSSY
jgi:hypothetical protein